MSFHSIHKIFIGDLKKEYNFFFRKKFWQKFLPSQKFLKKHGFSSFQKCGKMVDNPQKSIHRDDIYIYVSEGLENTEKSTYPQFGLFRWTESADPTDLTKSENFIFFDFLRSFYVHFPHCTLIFLANMEFWAEITTKKMIILHEI